MNNEKRNALWFGKIAPTSAEVEQIQKMGYEQILHNKTLNQIEYDRVEESLAAVAEVVRQMRYCATCGNATAIFGRFPAALQSAAWRWAAGWLVATGDMWPNAVVLFSPEGEKWVEVGAI